MHYSHGLYFCGFQILKNSQPKPSSPPSVRLSLVLRDQCIILMIPAFSKIPLPEPAEPGSKLAGAFISLDLRVQCIILMTSICANSCFQQSSPSVYSQASMPPVRFSLLRVQCIILNSHFEQNPQSPGGFGSPPSPSQSLRKVRYHSFPLNPARYSHYSLLCEFPLPGTCIGAFPGPKVISAFISLVLRIQCNILNCHLEVGKKL
jgi:hypothetical protein